MQTMATDLAASPSIAFTYSMGVDSLFQRSIIRAIEAIGGQRRLKFLYDRFTNGLVQEQDFFEAAVQLLELNVSFDENRLRDIPKTGPVVFIANHPYGVLDGILLTWLARKARPDVKVLANHVLCQAPDAAGHLLPVDFSGNEAARLTNISTRQHAMQSLQQGGAVGIFPAGGVAVSEKPFRGPAVDTPWHPFSTKLIRMSGATVIPIYFSGQNSRLFQMASHYSYTLRLALFFFETARRIGSEMDIVIGDAIKPEEIAGYKNRTELTKVLRDRTFSLARQLPEPRTGYPQADREFVFRIKTG